MLDLSEIIIQNPQINSFEELLTAVRLRGSEGQILLHFDIKPDYPDTPRNWQWALEAAFTERRQ
jgi:hypothetical protein